MKNHQPECALSMDPMGAAHAGRHELGVYRPGFRFKRESLAFFRRCVGEEAYERAMQSEVGKRYHFVVARAFLNQKDWEKFVWIEKYGSLKDFPG